jgi:transmembrane sensor
VCSTAINHWRWRQRSDWLLIAPDDIPSDLDPLLREALAWVVRLHSGAATSEDAEALAQWRQRDDEHEAAFRDAVKLWRTFGDATRRLAGATDGAQSPTSSRSTVRRIVSRRAIIGGSAIAASLGAAYAIVRPPLELWPSLAELTADYRTGKGEQRKVALLNNVSLELNTETSIAVRSVKNDPRIEVISGEAAISAARDGLAPLVVDAANGRITALQADFEVRCFDDKVTVSCIDGAVDVGVGGRTIHVAKAQQVSYSAGGGLTALTPVDPVQATAWQNGLLIVHDWQMSRVVDEINRYRPGQIVIMNSKLGRRKITGTFYLSHLDDFLGQAHSLFDASVRYLPGGIVLLS